ncbi:MAG: ATP-binding protein [Oscillospiraceae bacterium]|nr:ATP-binding protein [Oscillospiraceae bacterium]
MKELKTHAKLENLSSVLDFVTLEMEAAEFPLKLQTSVCIAVEEIFVNIANYAYHPDTGEVLIRMSVGNEIVIEFQDGGRAYNPLESPTPDITKSAQEREIGGLGVFMVKQMMDMVEYRYEDGKNILVIRKNGQS